MAKSIPSSGAGAVRIILKNKDAFHFDLIEKSDEYANTDNLTLLYNHRGFQEILSNEIERAKTNKQQLSIVMMDICNITRTAIKATPIMSV